MKKNTAVMLILTLIFVQTLFTGGIKFALAEGTVELTGALDRSTVIPLDGKFFINPMGPGSYFKMNYSINNQSGEKVVFYETVIDRNGSAVVGSSPFQPVDIKDKQSMNIEGANYIAKPEQAPYTIQYHVVSNASGVLLKSGHQTVDMVNDQIDVSYEADQNQVYKGDMVNYTVHVKSRANVDLYNITVKDDKLGYIGSIAVLKSGAEETLDVHFTLDKSVESHAVLTYDDPLGIRETLTQRSNMVYVDVRSEAAPIESLQIEQSADRAYLSSKGEVNFTFHLKNTGDVRLTNIQCIDWTGKVFNTINKLDPNEEATVQQKWVIEPDEEYTVICRTSRAGKAERTQYQVSLKIPKLDPRVEIVRAVSPQIVKAGETVKIEYIVRNTGNVTLTDLKMNEPEMGQVGTHRELDPGEEWRFTKEREMAQDGYSKPGLTARVKGLDIDYENYESTKINIPVEIPAGEPHITITVSSTPESLEKAGTVGLEFKLLNDGDAVIKNVSAVLVERDNLSIGSLLSMEPGEEKIFNIPQLGVDETESFTVLVKGNDRDGKSLEFTQNFEIRVGEKAEEPETEEPGTDDEEEPPQKSKSNRNLSILRTILITILFMIIMVSGALVYYIKKG